jgi:hypothetical protein
MASCSQRTRSCGPSRRSAVGDPRQIKSHEAHTCDRFSESVLKPYGLVLCAVFIVNTWVCVSQECHVDFAVHASQAQRVDERVTERMKHLAAVSNAMCPSAPTRRSRPHRAGMGAEPISGASPTPFWQRPSPRRGAGSVTLTSIAA